MSYLTQAALADDEWLLRRVTACAVLEGIPSPDGWAYQHRWELSAQPGWDAAYEYAVNSKVERPGADGGVIQDAQILAAVQALQKAEKAP